MTDTVKSAAIGIKRMGVILWCVAAICLVVYITRPDTGETPMVVIITALTLIAALGGVDRLKQVKDA